MNATRATLAIAVLLPAMLAAGTASAQPQAAAQQQAAPSEPRDESTAESIRHYAVARRVEATAAARRATTALDAQIEELQGQVDERWSRMSQDTRARSQATMAELRRRRTDAAEWYGGMRHGSAGAWVEVRDGFARSYRDLADALRRARTQFKQQPDDAAKPASEPAPGHSQ